jgi:hypothetical protein
MAKKWQNANTQMVPIDTVPIHARQVTVVASGKRIRSNREAPGTLLADPTLPQSCLNSPVTLRAVAGCVAHPLIHDSRMAASGRRERCIEIVRAEVQQMGK